MEKNDFVIKEQKLKTELLAFFSWFYYASCVIYNFLAFSVSQFSHLQNKYNNLSSLNILQGDSVHQHPPITTQIPSRKKGRHM